MAINQTPKTQVVHSFKNAYAARYGVNEVLVPKFLTHKTRKSTNIREGKAWNYDTYTKIAERFPYMSRTSIVSAIGSGS